MPKTALTADESADVRMGHSLPDRHGPRSLQVSWSSAPADSRSRYHVPLQSLGVVLTFIGQFLGHHHGGREFPATVCFVYECS